MIKFIPLLILIIIFVLLFLVPYLKRRKDKKLLCSVTEPQRGTKSERQFIIDMLKKGINSNAIFHDLYVQKKNGDYSQIDVVVVVPQGLLIIEIKDYGGWIFGNENQKYWTQILNYGEEKYRFYNPILQNIGHIKALREQSEQFASLPVFNIVLFTNNCVLKNITYNSVDTYVGYLSDIGRIIETISTYDSAVYTDENEIKHVFYHAIRNGKNPEVVASHKDMVKKYSEANLKL